MLVRRDNVLQVAGVVTWGGETLGRACGKGPAVVSERVLAHLPLVTGPRPKTFAPYATSDVTISRTGKCRRATWRPRSAKLTVRYVRRGTKRSCIVIARTPGGWSQPESYNEV